MVLISILVVTILFNTTTVNLDEETMINPGQLRNLVVTTLKSLEPEIPYSDAAVELIMLTAAVESNLGTYITQVGGPAKGIFQMEPATELDIWKNYLVYKPTLQAKVLSYRVPACPVKHELEWNLVYAIVMTRIKYLRSPVPMPANNKAELARVWKEVYNTRLGKGTVEKAIQKYTDMVET